MELRKRAVFAELLSQGKDRKISFLIGPRQVGKTTLLKQLYEELCIIQGNRGVFLDLDIFTNFEKVSSFENLGNLLAAEGYEKGGKGAFYLFLDEFQRYSDLSIIMKNAYDNLSNLKIYASGSSSLKIKDSIQESLAGRKRINVIYPLGFGEFLQFRGEAALLGKLARSGGISGRNVHKTMPELGRMLEEFMVFGGYPEVAIQREKAKKEQVLESIFDLYLRKDLMEYLNVKKIAEVKKLIELLAVNNGQKIRYDELAKVCSLSVSEVKAYIEILIETYMVMEVRPFFTNKNKEIVKIPKIYFADNGVRNYFVHNFNPTRIRQDAGFLFEGHLLSELLKSGAQKDSLRFWQDKNGREVDFVLESAGKNVPIEAKFKASLKASDETGLKAFLGQYPMAGRAFLVNLGEQSKKGKISFVLPYLLPQNIGKLKYSK